MTAWPQAQARVLANFDVPALLAHWAEVLTRPPGHWHVVAHTDCAPQVQSIRDHANADHPERVDALAQACWGLLPGRHRLRLRVASHPDHVLHLTLHVGETPAMETTSPASVSERGQRVAVLGAGISGAACARALAERGYRVTVLDQGKGPATGASGLPVGLVAPHTSPDDSLISRLSRAGVRAMRDAMQHRLQAGRDWSPTGVQERRLPGKTRKGGAPASWSGEWRDSAAIWTQAATDPHLPPNTLWHAQGAWVRPSQLVHALLDHPAIDWRACARAQRLERRGALWQIWGDEAPNAEPIHACEQLVLACGPGIPPLLQTSGLTETVVPIRPLRGQLSWGLMTSGPSGRTAWPTSPVNGHGSFVHGVDTGEGPAWFAGSTYDRVNDQATVHDADHHENLQRLHALLPQVAADLRPAFASQQVRGWAGVRCHAPDRLPLVGRVPQAPDGLWLCSAMGSRGLTLAVLCAEVLAAQWCGEPLPIEPQLAKALSSERFSR